MRKKQRNENRLSYKTNGKFEQNYVVGSLVQKLILFLEGR